jgi:hypothetical protein
VYEIRNLNLRIKIVKKKNFDEVHKMDSKIPSRWFGCQIETVLEWNPLSDQPQGPPKPFPLAKECLIR